MYLYNYNYTFEFKIKEVQHYIINLKNAKK